jgi:spermidine synthase
MTETTDRGRHAQPLVDVSLTRKVLHFSIGEIQSCMDLRDPYALDLEYTRTMMGFLLLLPQPRDIVMIGLGGGSLAKFCHRHLPAARIEVVEVNPHVIALRDEFHVPRDDERFQVIAGDGAHHVRHRAMPCDVLMIDGFDDDGQPDSLCSQRFYDDAHDVLRSGGVMVANLHSQHVDHAAHIERIRRSFSGEVLVVDDGEGSNSVVFACPGPALARMPAGPVRAARGLSRAGTRELIGAFALVTSAWRDQRGPAYSR